jgi:predicted RNA-binding Zn ribbon-like protein
MPAGKNFQVRHQIVIPRREMAIDYANTVAWRGSKPEDSLLDFAGLSAWLASAKVLPQVAVSGLPRLFASAQADPAKVWADAIALRETIYRLLHMTAAKLPLASNDLRRLNGALTEAPARSSLEYKEQGTGWVIELRPTAAGILAPVLWSAADLLTGPDLTRVRECANPQCLWLFIDDSKNGTRRWCSMQACGNRAKAHRHYQRKKECGE